jgi:valyl-tRNA synthetase
MVEQYGADAFRFTLASGSGYNRTINLDPDRIQGFRNFVNKVWNAFRFIYPHLEKGSSTITDMLGLDHHERWILAELNTTTKLMNHSFEIYRYDDASSAIYTFVYDKYCSWFIELSKNILNGTDESKKARRVSVLKFVMRKMLALMHPITPFITEELWGYLKGPNEGLLITTEYPEYTDEFEFLDDQDKMNKFVETVTGIRNLRQSVNIKPKDEVTVEVFADNMDLINYFRENAVNFSELARVKYLKVGNKELNRPSKSIMLATTFAEIFLPLEGVIDLQEQINRLEKDLDKTLKEYSKYETKIKNENFMKNAPEEVRAEVQTNEALLREKIESIKNNLIQFKS